MRKLFKNFITFKYNNTPCIVTNVCYNNNKEIINFAFTVLNKYTRLKDCYDVKDMNEFLIFKKHLIDITINGTSTFKTIDLSSINLL